jgi:hypothetical protein
MHIVDLGRSRTSLVSLDNDRSVHLRANRGKSALFDTASLADYIDGMEGLH